MLFFPTCQCPPDGGRPLRRLPGAPDATDSESTRLRRAADVLWPGRGAVPRATVTRQQEAQSERAAAAALSAGLWHWTSSAESERAATAALSVGQAVLVKY